MRTWRFVIPLLIAALISVSCGSDDDAADPPSSTTSTVASTTSSTGDTTTTAGDTASSSTTAPSTTGGNGATSLPGEPFDLAPVAGSELAVMGVQYDDVLNVRALPGADQAVVAELAPTSGDLVATGQARMLPQSIWFEVTTGDSTVGWVNSRFVARIGPTVDLTAEVVDELGEIPAAETMLDLGMLVAEALAPENGEASTTTTTVAPSVGDLGEITVDLVGLADDATAGLRLHVFGQPDESGEGFSLKSVEATEMCVAVRGGGSAPSEICA